MRQCSDESCVRYMRFKHPSKMVVLTSDFIKCVVVGDDSVGKTSLLMCYATNRFPSQRVPSVFDNYAGCITLYGEKYNLELIDTLEKCASDENRQTVYPGTDVVAVCFSVVKPKSFLNVEVTWLPEIRKCMGNVPVILVGTQTDLRNDIQTQQTLRQNNQRPIKMSQGVNFAKRVGAACYIESSSMCNRHMRKTINRAIALSLMPKDHHTEMTHSQCTIL